MLGPGDTGQRFLLTETFHPEGKGKRQRTSRNRAAGDPTARSPALPTTHSCTPPYLDPEPPHPSIFTTHVVEGYAPAKERGLLKPWCPGCPQGHLQSTWSTRAWSRLHTADVRHSRHPEHGSPRPVPCVHLTWPQASTTAPDSNGLWDITHPKHTQQRLHPLWQPQNHHMGSMSAALSPSVQPPLQWPAVEDRSQAAT